MTLPPTRPLLSARLRSLRSAGLLLLPLLLGPALAADDETAPAAAPDFELDVRPVLQDFCFRCHGEKRQKGNVRLDVLDPDLVEGPDAEAWHMALNMIQSGDMPPPRMSQPTDEERRKVVAWIRSGLDAAARAGAGERETVLRRLTKAQYTNTLQDLLGVPADFGNVLPDDGKSEMGFTNNGEVLLSSQLHLEYYQSIAREALDKALAIGERPEVTRYRVTFGKGRGKDLAAGHTGGYQSVPLNTNDFTVDILDASGAPKVGATPQEQEALDEIKRRISIGLRGSSQSRFRVVDEGMLLYSALPHKEKVPKAWQGPSPNVKLEMQRCFPEEGDFVMRVRASRGYLFEHRKRMLIELEQPIPLSALVGEPVDVATLTGAIVLRAPDSDDHKNLLPGGAGDELLLPEIVTDPSSARFKVKVPADGYYQVDLVHPFMPADAMPSVRLSLASQNLDRRLEPDEVESAPERVVTALAAAYLPAGTHDLRVGGPFFVGFSHVVLTPITEEHRAVAPLIARTDELAESLQAKTPGLRAFVGTRLDDGMDYKTFDVHREVDAPLGEPATYSFVGRLENLPIPEPESGDTEVLSGFMLLGVWNDHLVKDASDPGPPLLIESIEFEAPYFPEWPPASHTAIFFDSPSRAIPEVYAREVIERFLGRAFRRDLSAAELDRYMAFWQAIRPDHDTYEHSVREVLVAGLCSPHFLFLAEPVAEPEAEPAGDTIRPDEALATRLAYFLWNSPPDRELRDLAREGRLTEELEAQVDRMLDDPRAWRFVRSFVYEWLRIDRHETMDVNVDTYPAFTRFVKRDMSEETYHFVHQVLARDLSVFNLVDSDFVMLNQNLAEFYGVEGVEGAEFRPVELARERGRGGLLSQGAFLSGHSDGSQAHAIKRAVWVKEKILGDPPPPPPPNVPELNPEAPGFENLTLKEQLELHRDSPSCMDCHRGIDPYGVVFERYDAAGLWHEERDGEPIDALSTLPDGAEVDGVSGLKAYILEQQPDAFTGALIEHLYAFALGRDVHFADEEELSRILLRVKSDDYRMRSVIKGIVSSSSFSQP
ncbi:MAG: DUF1592 domain-containing protein [Planctomycetota bacterium]